MNIANEARRRTLEMCFGLALFGVNAAFSLLLYLEIASGVWYYQVMYGTLAIVFDASMLLLWMRGLRLRNGVFIGIAIAFACITLFASSASALTIIERKVHIVEADSSNVDGLRDALQQTDADIAINRSAIEKTPPDFTTRLRELNALAASLRERRDTQDAALRLAQQSSAAARSTATSMFSLVAKTLRVSDERVMLPFLLGTSLMLLVGSFALTAPPHRSIARVPLAQYGALVHFLRKGKPLCGARTAPPSGPGMMCALCRARMEEQNGSS